MKYTHTHTHTRFSFFRNFLLVAMLAMIWTACSQQEVEPELSYGDESVATRSFEVGQSCAPDFGNFECDESTLIQEVQHPDYPGCTFRVRVQTVRCSNLSPLPPNVYAGDYEILFHDCPQFDIDLAAASVSDPSLHLFVHDFDQGMYSVLEPIIASLDTPIPDCDNGVSVGVTWVRASCFALCVSSKSLAATAFSKFTKWTCVDSGCCFRRTTLCREDDGTFTPTTTVTETTASANCADARIYNYIVDIHGNPVSQDPSTCIYVTACDFRCEPGR